MSNYHKKFVEILGDSGLWPDFSRPDFMQSLDSAASEAFNKQTLEGYLAAFLIYQQISEDMVRNVISLGRLYNQAAVFPLEMNYKSLDGSKMTFGALLQELQVIPHQGSELSDLCERLNTLRVQLVHKITLKESLDEIEKKCQEAAEIYKKIETKYFHLEDEYRMGLSDFKDRVDEWKAEYKELYE